MHWTPHTAQHQGSLGDEALRGHTRQQHGTSTALDVHRSLFAMMKGWFSRPRHGGIQDFARAHRLLAHAPRAWPGPRARILAAAAWSPKEDSASRATACELHVSRPPRAVFDSTLSGLSLLRFFRFLPAAYMRQGQKPFTLKSGLDHEEILLAPMSSQCFGAFWSWRYRVSHASAFFRRLRARRALLLRIFLARRSPLVSWPRTVFLYLPSSKPEAL